MLGKSFSQVFSFTHIQELIGSKEKIHALRRGKLFRFDVLYRSVQKTDGGRNAPDKLRLQLLCLSQTERRPAILKRPVAGRNTSGHEIEFRSPVGIADNSIETYPLTALKETNRDLGSKSVIILVLKMRALCTRSAGQAALLSEIQKNPIQICNGFL